MIEEEYDVVLDALQSHHDKLRKMTEANMLSQHMNIMDDIRLQQIAEIKEAIRWWKERKETIRWRKERMEMIEK